MEKQLNFFEDMDFGSLKKISGGSKVTKFKPVIGYKSPDGLYVFYDRCGRVLEFLYQGDAANKRWEQYKVEDKFPLYEDAEWVHEAWDSIVESRSQHEVK